jgi:hypothetical protein
MNVRHNGDYPPYDLYVGINLSLISSPVNLAVCFVRIDLVWRRAKLEKKKKTIYTILLTYEIGIYDSESEELILFVYSLLKSEIKNNLSRRLPVK